MSIIVCNMLYVKDVPNSANFWKSIGFIEISRSGKAEQEIVVLSPFEEATARLQLWNVDFIRQVSPEVAEAKSSLLFTVDDLESWHEKVSKVAVAISEINEVPFKNFNFQDFNGDYYAFAEEKVKKF